MVEPLGGLVGATTVGFSDALLLRALGFDERIRGDNHIFTRRDVDEIMNLQPIGAKAKPSHASDRSNLSLIFLSHTRGAVQNHVPGTRSGIRR